MKRGVGVLTAVLLLLIIGAVSAAPRWVLYPETSKASKYPGNSQVVRELGRQFLADPKENGTPIFVTEYDLVNYPADLYNLLEIPPQEKLFYAAGRVRRWEETAGSDKLYLVLGHESGEERYRITGETAVADVAAFPALGLILGAYGLVTMPLENAVSRWRERKADEYALQATGKREAFASAFTRLANQNLGEVDPEKWVVFLFYSHPPLGERIAKAQAWQG